MRELFSLLSIRLMSAKAVLLPSLPPPPQLYFSLQLEKPSIIFTNVHLIIASSRSLFSVDVLVKSIPGRKEHLTGFPELGRDSPQMQFPCGI